MGPSEPGSFARLLSLVELQLMSNTISQRGGNMLPREKRSFPLRFTKQFPLPTNTTVRLSLGSGRLPLFPAPASLLHAANTVLTTASMPERLDSPRLGSLPSTKPYESLKEIRQDWCVRDGPDDRVGLDSLLVGGFNDHYTGFRHSCTVHLPTIRLISTTSMLVATR